MLATKEIAARALRGALDVRKRAGVDVTAPVCPFELARELGVQVWFVAGNSFGGMYAKDFRNVLVPVQRPPARQVSTCAHELGHWHFRHGNRVEDIAELDKWGDDDPDEQLVKIFACYLLMPIWAVRRAFYRRQLTAGNCKPEEIYRVSSQLGVGYETLVQHMRYSLRLLGDSAADTLLSVSPQQIRRRLTGDAANRHLVVADTQWESLPIDLRVGDDVLLPEGAVVTGERTHVSGVASGGVVVQADEPGFVQASVPGTGWCAFVRICRREYAGLAQYRHLEDPDVD